MTGNLETRLREIWEDQRAFNLLLRQPPETPEVLAEQVSDFVQYTSSELHELLRSVPWKKHRKVPVLHNSAHMEEEGMDIFKCVLSILQIIGIDNWDQLIDLYWRKTAVVRQRYREEWIDKIDGPCAVVDIDNVICDYISGLLSWLMVHSGRWIGYERFKILLDTRPYINAQSLGVQPEVWLALKHEFRVSGVKRTLPVFPDAKPFLLRLRESGYKIILLTSRPIDKYPNIFTDTILWLNNNELPFDFVWWSTDKSDRLSQIEGIRDHIRFAVDDDWTFVEQFATLRIPTYWLKRETTFPAGKRDEYIEVVKSLSDIEVHDHAAV